MKRTPLFDAHVALGAKIVPFAGWDMPVQYSGVIAEHSAVRTSAGIFDVSHMGEIFVEGAGALRFLQKVTCNDLATIKDGQAQYTALLNEQGGIIDDIITYRFGAERFLLCVNASNADVDFAWLEKQADASVSLHNASAEWGQIAVQGPKAITILSELLEVNLFEIQFFHFREIEWQGITMIAARTGYTGEDGFELFIPWEKTAQVWQLLCGSSDVLPCGLAARDTLRLEACLPLHGHELATDITALESELGRFIKFDKGEFIGRAALEKQQADGLQRRLVAFEVTDLGVARQGDLVFAPSGEEIGQVTSGTRTPTLEKSVGLALVKTPWTAAEATIAIQVRDKRLHARVVAKPLYRRAKSKS